MHNRLCLLALVLMVSCNTPDCIFKLPDGVYVKQMKDESWIIVQGENFGQQFGILYYYVGDSPYTSTGWLNTDVGTEHFGDSCSAKGAFDKFMNHIHFK